MIQVRFLTVETKKQVSRTYKSYIYFAYGMLLGVCIIGPRSYRERKDYTNDWNVSRTISL